MNLCKIITFYATYCYEYTLYKIRGVKEYKLRFNEVNDVIVLRVFNDKLINFHIDKNYKIVKISKLLEDDVDI